MGLLGSIINIIGKGVAKGVSEVVEKKVAEAVKPAATKLAKKQADLIDSVTRDIERAGESINQAGEAAEKAATENPEELKRAMEILRQSAQKASGD